MQVTIQRHYADNHIETMQIMQIETSPNRTQTYLMSLVCQVQRLPGVKGVHKIRRQVYIRYQSVNIRCIQREYYSTYLYGLPHIFRRQMTVKVKLFPGSEEVPMIAATPRKYTQHGYRQCTPVHKTVALSSYRCTVHTHCLRRSRDFWVCVCVRQHACAVMHTQGRKRSAWRPPGLQTGVWRRAAQLWRHNATSGTAPRAQPHHCHCRPLLPSTRGWRLVEMVVEAQPQLASHLVSSLLMLDAR